MIVACDVDEVVVDLMPEWIGRYNADYGDTLTVDAIHKWEIEEFVKPECGRRIYDYLSDDDLYESSQPVPDAIGGILALRDMGIRVVFVTSQDHPRKRAWLERHGLLTLTRRGSSDDYVAASDKGLVCGDVLIDDYLHNLERFDRPWRTPIIFDRPWNRIPDGEWNPGCNSRRACNWVQVVAAISLL
jgi:5'-nucleotidase